MHRRGWLPIRSNSGCLWPHAVACGADPSFVPSEDPFFSPTLRSTPTNPGHRVAGTPWRQGRRGQPEPRPGKRAKTGRRGGRGRGGATIGEDGPNEAPRGQGEVGPGGGRRVAAETTSLTSSVLGPSAYGRPRCTPGNCRPGGERLLRHTRTGKGWMALRTALRDPPRTVVPKKWVSTLFLWWPRPPGVPTQPITLNAHVAGNERI